jgi:hypothetical protein
VRLLVLLYSETSKEWDQQHVVVDHGFFYLTRPQQLAKLKALMQEKTGSAHNYSDFNVIGRTG